MASHTGRVKTHARSGGKRAHRFGTEPTAPDLKMSPLARTVTTVGHCEPSPPGQPVMVPLQCGQTALHGTSNEKSMRKTSHSVQARAECMPTPMQQRRTPPQTPDINDESIKTKAIRAQIQFNSIRFQFSSIQFNSAPPQKWFRNRNACH